MPARAIEPTRGKRAIVAQFPSCWAYDAARMLFEGTYQLVVFSRDEARVFPLPRAGDVVIGRDEANLIRMKGGMGGPHEWGAMKDMHNSCAADVGKSAPTPAKK